ncbi:MAG: hypothetical protein ACKOCU_03025 [Betaproteobacteria bacterium]
MMALADEVSPEQEHRMNLLTPRANATPSTGATAPSATIRHPLVQAACHASPGRNSRLGRAARFSSDPDQMVMVSCLASFLVLPFIL